MELSDRIRYAISRSGKTQAEVARSLHISRAAVSQWCTGQTNNIRMEHLFSLARIVRFNPEWLATGNGPERPPKPLRDLTAAEEKLLGIWREMLPETKRQCMSQAILHRYLQAGSDKGSAPDIASLQTEIDKLDFSQNGE